MSTSLAQISKLQQQIAQLKDAAINELKARRIDLENELTTVNAELATLVGQPITAKRQRTISPGQMLVEQERSQISRN